MPAKRLVIFANPIAGRGRGKSLARKLEQLAVVHGFSVKTFFDRPEDISLSDLEQPTETVVAIGGDGTLRSVVNLFYAAHAKGPAVLPVPMGTANLMGQHLGIAWSARDACGGDRNDPPAKYRASRRRAR